VNTKRLHFTLYTEEFEIIRIEIRLPIRVSMFLKERFDKLADGVRFALYETLGPDRLIDKINLLVEMELFKNIQQAIQFYLMIYYFKENNLHGSADNDLFITR